MRKTGERGERGERASSWRRGRGRGGTGTEQRSYTGTTRQDCVPIASWHCAKAFTGCKIQWSFTDRNGAPAQGVERPGSHGQTVSPRKFVMRSQTRSPFQRGSAGLSRAVTSIRMRVAVRGAMALFLAIAPLMAPSRASAQRASAKGVSDSRTGKQTMGITADQRLLRLLADHYESMRTIAHDRMMQPGGHSAHGKQNDPASLDGEYDMLQAEALRLLASVYHDEYSARAAKLGLEARGSLTPPMEASHDKARLETAAWLHDTIAAIDSFRGSLHQKEVKQLAARHRVLLAGWLSELKVARQPALR